MQVAAASPRYVRREDVPADELEQRARHLPRAGRAERQAGAGDRAHRRRARSSATCKDVCLLEQAFIKQSDRTVKRRGAGGDRPAGREHHRPPLRALPARRVAGATGGEQTAARRPPLEARPEPEPGPASPRTGRYRRVLLKLSGEALAGAGRLRHRPAACWPASPPSSARSTPLGCELALVIGGGNIFRGLAGSARRHRPRHRRLHGHARHRHQRAGAAGRAREARRADARAVGDRDAAGRRALHPPPRHAPPREGPRRHLRRRHRQSVLHHRHRREPARHGDRRRGDLQGDQGRRRLRRRSREASRARRASTSSPTSTCSIASSR